MEKSKLFITIQKESDNYQCSLDEDGEKNKKIGSGSIIGYNPAKTSSPHDGKRNPIYGLAHELGHAYDAMRGMINDTKVPVFKKNSPEGFEIPISDIRAVRFENKVRPYTNQRTTYDGCDLTPYKVIMKFKFRMLRRYRKIKGDMPLFSGEDRGRYSVCNNFAAKLLSFIFFYLHLSPSISIASGACES